MNPEPVSQRDAADGGPVLFSVITPTYNCVAKIDATVQSVLTQPGVTLEHLIIDGGSTDGTPAALGAYRSPVRWFSERDAGIYDAMNKGIALARGRFLYFLGAGDRLRPGVLRAVADLLPQDASTADRPCDFVYGDVHWPWLGGRYGGEFDARRLARSNINHQAIFYGRGVFDLVGEYDLRYKLCADFALNIRCFGLPAIRKTHLDVIVADFEDGGASATRDRAFYADMPGLVWRCLGPGAGLSAWFHNASYFQGWHRLWYHLRQPWRTLPARVRRWTGGSAPGPR